jgi:aminomethyltransferase
MTLKRTPLYAAHQKLGARLVEFGGWDMPVQYTSIVDEHLAVRKTAGIFDICHMGEVLVAGPKAAVFLNQTLTNDITRLLPGNGQYTLMPNEQGGVIDDLYAYRIGPEQYLLIINASRIANDVAWLTRQLGLFHDKAGVSLQNVSEITGAVAVQGPRVAGFIAQCFPGLSLAGASVASVTDLEKNQIAQFGFQGTPVWVARTGYTGEDGFEIVAPAVVVEPLWNALLGAGESSGLKPAGLGARDTLRTEMCYPLYGHELDETITPIEAGVGFFVALDKGEFTGRAVMAEQKAGGVTRRRIAFRMLDKSAPPRPHYPVWSTGPDAKVIGEVASGTQSPSLNCGIGMAYVPPAFSKIDTRIEIEVRGRKYPAVVSARPLYRPAS